VTTGAESDLEHVSRIARAMVGRWGMSDRIGTLSVLPTDGDPRMMGISDGLLDMVDDEVRRIVADCYAEARRLLRENRHRLDALVEALLKQETLEEAAIYAVAGIDRPPPPPALEAPSAPAPPAPSGATLAHRG
jgi:cell division protease FtsH